MGINGLHDIIKKYAPQVYHKKYLSEYAYKKVAIDTTLFLFKYKSILGDRWINGFLNLITSLRKNDIHCVFIEDGIAPKEKSLERQKRMEQREKLEKKIFDISTSLENYYNTNEVDEILLKICEDENKNEIIIKNLFRNTNSQNNNFDVKVCENYLKKIKLQNVKITKDDFDLVEKIFELLGIPYFKSETEAETFCCYLQRFGYVDAVLSEDTDVLAYGTSIFLTKINTSDESVVEIDYSVLIETLGISSQSFTDLCILCGNDYNDNMKGIGPDKGYKLIKTYGSIEEIEEIKDLKTGNNKFDTSILNYKRTRELFKIPDKLEFEIPYCKSANIDKIKEFFLKNNVKYDISNIEICLKNNEVEFED